MLDNTIIKKVLRLLKTGRFSQRAIARKLGISNTLVSNIQKGKRKLLHEKEYRLIEPEGNLVRCHHCGQLTRLPCMNCQIRNILQNFHINRLPDTPIDESDSDICLSGDMYKRYCEVRDWRQKQKNPHFIILPDDWPWKTEENTKCPQT